VEGRVTIIDRFRGPPRSGNGGYACGLVAREVPGDEAEVTLRRPPPLGRSLAVVHDGETVRLEDGGQVVAEGRPAHLDIDLPALIPAARVVDAAARFDEDAYQAAHAFPECFTCGPDRDDGDGLRLFPAAVEPGVVAWPWEPTAAIVEGDGLVPDEILWAALDCPSGLAWMGDAPGAADAPAVLGRMTAGVQRRPAVGERLVVMGWRIAREGRRLLAGSAVYRADGGEVLAANRAVWVLLDEEQRAAFATAT
jgi:hypothetical protein